MRRWSAASLSAYAGLAHELPPSSLEASTVDGPRPFGDALADGAERRVELPAPRRDDARGPALDPSPRMTEPRTELTEAPAGQLDPPKKKIETAVRD